MKTAAEDYYTLVSIQQDLLANKITCAELVQGYLANAQSKAHLNAFLELYNEDAIASAEALDAKIAKGEKLGKLYGLVIALKDTISHKGYALAASSKILEGYTALFNATAVDRLLAEDAIIIGRTNCDEFAMGSSNENSAYGNVKNADDETRVPGGSSGGSAVAVQGGMCLASLGSDTGGSIRQPASLCGVVGVKPTYGRVSRYGLIAYGSSFDQIGPFTKSIEDAAIITEVMAGEDEKDSTSSTREVGTYTNFSSNDEPKKIAYIQDVLEHDGLSPEIKEHANSLIEKLKAEGHTVEPISFPYLDYLIPTYYVLTTAEASSNLARYDGIRFGYRSEDAQNIEEVYKMSRSQGFGDEVKRRIMLGTFVLSAGYYDAYYTQAMKVRRVVTNAVQDIFKNYDFILSPTTPDVAFEIGAKSADPVTMYLSDIYTVLANLSGVPAISLPMYKDKNGLAIGIQLMANNFEEAKMFDFSKKLMSNS